MDPSQGRRPWSPVPPHASRRDAGKRRAEPSRPNQHVDGRIGATRLILPIMFGKWRCVSDPLRQVIPSRSNFPVKNMFSLPAGIPTSALYRAE